MNFLIQDVIYSIYSMHKICIKVKSGQINSNKSQKIRKNQESHST